MKLTEETLRQQRESLGVSQAEIARRAGVTRATINKYEKGDGLKYINKVLEAYCLEIYPLVGTIPADLKEITDTIEKNMSVTYGMKCKVKLNIEFCGKDGRKEHEEDIA